MSEERADSMLHLTARESVTRTTDASRACPRFEGRQTRRRGDVRELLPHGGGQVAPAEWRCEDLKATSHRKISCGFVTLTLMDSGKWKARYIEPDTGRSIRRVLQVTEQEQAEEWANEMNRSILGDRGILPSAKAKATSGPTVADAIEESLRAHAGGALSVRRCVSAANLFQAFLKAKYPVLRNWGDVRPSMISAWIQEMQQRELAFDTIRLNIAPIRQASAYWAAEYPDRFRHVFKQAKFKLERPLHKQPRALSADELRMLLQWICDNRPYLHPIACLSGLSGLRQLEAAYVRHCDIDWTAGTVTVAKTALHTPKNRASYRTIPVHPEVLEAVRFYIATQAVRDVCDEAPVFLHCRGTAWKFHGITGAWQEAIVAARKVQSLAFLQGFKPRELRATFATLACQGKANTRALQLYLGHTPTDILGQHYERITVDDLRREVVTAFARAWEVSGHNSVTSASDAQ